jgi:UDP-N-acetylglucosamine 2-epimerase (non-hydrolysing)
VQEEVCILGVPCVVIRDVTERPETVDAGASMLAGVDPSTIFDIVCQITKERPEWMPPIEYLRQDVADTVVRVVGR